MRTLQDDERGLSDLGRAFLETLAAVAPDGPGPRPIIDLAHSNPSATSDILAWFEADAARVARMIPVYSHGCLARSDQESPRAITRDVPPLAGIIRRDARVPEAIRRQTPLLTRHPGCTAAADVVALAGSLTG